MLSAEGLREQLLASLVQREVPRERRRDCNVTPCTKFSIDILTKYAALQSIVHPDRPPNASRHPIPLRAFYGSSLSHYFSSVPPRRFTVLPTLLSCKTPFPHLTPLRPSAILDPRCSGCAAGMRGVSAKALVGSILCIQFPDPAASADSLRCASGFRGFFLPTSYHPVTLSP